ncbi:pentapeptide repeat-containing protein [Chondromyces crocatus]|uniref:pentapeptide repeat-containing protein n=1 Tax=Chondromyces crocatus TaxID=52 RepID=UPI0009EA7B96
MRAAVFLGGDFLEADFLEADFLEADFLGADFLGADFLGADFLEVGALEADFLEVGVLEAGFLEAGFLEADFLEAGFVVVFFVGAAAAGAAEEGRWAARGPNASCCASGVSSCASGRSVALRKTDVSSCSIAWISAAKSAARWPTSEASLSESGVIATRRRWSSSRLHVALQPPWRRMRAAAASILGRSAASRAAGRAGESWISRFSVGRETTSALTRSASSSATACSRSSRDSGSATVIEKVDSESENVASWASGS